MSKTIFLLRHAKSNWENPTLDDHDRPLNERGIRAAGRLGTVFDAIKTKPDFVLCSTATRARETLDYVKPFLPKTISIEYREDSYLAGPSTLFTILSAVEDQFERVMMVGHNPGTEELAALLVATGCPLTRAEMVEKYPTGALAIITAEIEVWRDLKFHANRLAAFIRPKFFTEDLKRSEMD